MILGKMFRRGVLPNLPQHCTVQKHNLFCYCQYMPLLRKFIALVILCCLTSSAMGKALVYILCLNILLVAILFGLSVLTKNLIWKLLTNDFKKAYKVQRQYFDAVFFFVIFLFCIVEVIINKKYLATTSDSIRILGNAATFVFALFIGWCLIRGKRGKAITIGKAAFALFLVMLSFVSLIALKPTKPLNDNSFIKTLSSLPYVNWVSSDKEVEETGVILYDRKLAYNGINLYHALASSEASLIDMSGNILHKWAKKLEGNKGGWTYVEMCKNGDLLVLTPQQITCLDWDSRIKWKENLPTHHDVSVDESNRIYVLSRIDELVFWRGIPVPILSDYIVVLSADRKVEREIRIYDVVEDYISSSTICRIYRKILSPKTLMQILTMGSTSWDSTHFDIMHTNNIEIMDRNIDDFCEKGDWLISVRQLDLIGIVSAKKEELVWSWGSNELYRQHHPTLLQNGNVLVFDNGCRRKGYSRIVELNPLTREIVWEYKSEPPEEFFSLLGGGCQRLSNGNTLIAECDKGHVFEITKEGKIVWEFYSPYSEMGKKARSIIYRMARFTDPIVQQMTKRRIQGIYQ